MFVLMVDDTQVPRGASGGFGGADDTARSEGTVTDGAQGSEAGAAEACAP